MKPGLARVLVLLSLMIWAESRSPVLGGTPEIWKFTFGTPDSVCRSGFTKVTVKAAFTPEKGFGFGSTEGLEALDRGGSEIVRPKDEYTASVYGAYRTTSDLTCALIEGTTENAFQVAMPDGEYTVWLIASDAEWDPPLFEVWADGQKKLDVRIPRRAFVFMEPFRARATGGRLKIEFKGRHGWILSALVIGKEGPALTDLIGEIDRDIFFLTKPELPKWKETKRHVHEEAARRNWPRLYFYPIDEPSNNKTENRMQFAQNVLDFVHAVPGCQTATTVGAGDIHRLGDRVDIRIYAYGDYNRRKVLQETQQGHPFWYYDNGMFYAHSTISSRNMTGFEFLRSGAEVATAWGFDCTEANPYNDFDGGHKDWNVVFPGVDKLTPTIYWELCREGVDDCRYVATLQEQIARAKARGRTAAAERAERVLRPLLDPDAPSVENPLAFSRYR